MFNYENDRIGVNEIITDFDKLGAVSIERIGKNIPYYGFDLPMQSQKECNGSCLDYINEYYEIIWEQVKITSKTDSNSYTLPSRICTKDDLP